MAEEKDPCSEGLTPECFAAHPAWAKRAFAYRLFCALAPPAISRRLQKYLLKAIFGPGVDFPPGIAFPPGMTFPPGYEFPPGWSPGDPLPGGFFFPPGFVFPAGWQPGDPMTWEMLLQLLGLDELPAGYPLPPQYLELFSGGPLRTGGGGAVAPEPIEVTITGSTADGKVQSKGAVWPTVRDAANWLEVNDASADESTAISAYYSGGLYYIQRSFLYFDLGALPTGKTVTGVIVGVMGMHDAESTVSIQKGTQGTPLSTSDFAACSGIFFASLTWKKYVAPDLNTNLFNLNAAGLAYVQSVLGETAKFCLREITKDHNNVAPVSNTPHNGMAYANHPTAAYKPYITIIYQ